MTEETRKSMGKILNALEDFQNLKYYEENKNPYWDSFEKSFVEALIGVNKLYKENEDMDKWLSRLKGHMNMSEELKEEIEHNLPWSKVRKINAERRENK